MFVKKAYQAIADIQNFTITKFEDASKLANTKRDAGLQFAIDVFANEQDRHPQERLQDDAEEARGDYREGAEPPVGALVVLGGTAAWTKDLLTGGIFLRDEHCRGTFLKGDRELRYGQQENREP